MCDKHCAVWQPKHDGNTMQEKPKKAALLLSEKQTCRFESLVLFKADRAI